MNIKPENNFTKGTIFLEGLKIGMTKYVQKKITEKDIIIFADVSGDHNPVHLNAEMASHTIFKKKIAHGLLTASFVSAVIGEYLPGHGTIYLSQTLEFLKPVFPDQNVKKTVIVERIIYKKRKVTLDCRCSVDETLVLSGKATVLAPSNKTKTNR